MNNQEPFGSVDIGIGSRSTQAEIQNDAIINGECLYLRDVSDKNLPLGTLKTDFLPQRFGIFLKGFLIIRSFQLSSREPKTFCR